MFDVDERCNQSRFALILLQLTIVTFRFLTSCRPSLLLRLALVLVFVLDGWRGCGTLLLSKLLALGLAVLFAGAVFDLPDLPTTVHSLSTLLTVIGA